MKDSLIYLVERLLKINAIYFDKDELGFQIQSHPSYPSLHAVTGVLDHFNIENVAVAVPINLETLEQLPDCFMAELTIDHSKSLTVVERNKANYDIYRAEHKKETVSKATFLERFTGIVVAVEKPEGTQVKTKPSKTRSYIGLGLLAVLASFLVFNTTVSIANIVYLVLSIIGVIISVAIVKQELGIKTAIGDAFCSGADTKKDCNAVLSSKGSEIIKGYKLSDFGLVYFVVLTVVTFIQIANPTLSFLVAVLAIPITLYSLYYQAVVLKTWCLLCLSTVGILWLQALIPLVAKTDITAIALNNSIVFGMVAISVSIAWYYIKRLVLDVNTLKKDKIEAVKFKRNFELFETMLNKAPVLDTSITESEDIIFGNHESPLEIVVVTSPFCGHCRPVHKQVHDILQKYNDHIKIRIRFNIGVKDETSDLVKIATKLIDIYREQGEYQCLLAMDDVYENGNYKQWLKTWGDHTPKGQSIIELKKEHTWCSDNGIHFTPEILINGKAFPKAYNRADLILFIEELEERSIENASTVAELKTV